MILVSPKVSFSYNIRSTLHPRTYFKRWRRGEVSSAGWISSARPPKKKKKEKELWATSGADEDTAPVIGRGVLTRGGGRAARVASCPHEEEHSGSQSQRETRASKPSTPKNSSLSLGRPRKTFLPPSPLLFHQVAPPSGDREKKRRFCFRFYDFRCLTRLLSLFLIVIRV